MLGALHEEAGELVSQQCLQVVRLFQRDAHAHRVDRCLDLDPLLGIPSDHNRPQRKLLALPAVQQPGEEPPRPSQGPGASVQIKTESRCHSLDFHFGLVVPFHRLGAEIPQAQGCVEGRADAVEVREQSHLRGHLRDELRLPGTSRVGSAPQVGQRAPDCGLGRIRSPIRASHRTPATSAPRALTAITQLLVHKAQVRWREESSGEADGKAVGIRTDLI
jgi:hypothetical protein